MKRVHEPAACPEPDLSDRERLRDSEADREEWRIRTDEAGASAEAPHVFEDIEAFVQWLEAGNSQS
ncbi:MAG: hypothetical protein IT303_00300 [Dehalococcoidia bacterium]|nr:hypothetical protein [Dehalococcoidia bacterium]